jgi:hypothetical protein
VSLVVDGAGRDPCPEEDCDIAYSDNRITDGLDRGVVLSAPFRWGPHFK